MKLLGIDPGTGRTGWGVIIKEQDKEQPLYVAHGCIVTSQDDAPAQRLLVLYETLYKLIESYAPDCIIVENIFFGRNAKTAISVSQARGVIMLSAAQFKLPVHEYTSMTVKKSLLGSGKADKKQIQVEVRIRLDGSTKKMAFDGRDKDFDDSADALAIAIHHAMK